jgi:hypothetical protein
MIVIKHKSQAGQLTVKANKAGPHPTAARVRELLDYDPHTDTFRWKVSRGRSKAGSLAGSRNKEGNIHIRIDGRLYAAKQLAQSHVSGNWVAKVDWYDRKLSDQYKQKKQRKPV